MKSKNIEEEDDIIEEEDAEKPNKSEGQKVSLDWDMDPTERLKVEMEALNENDQMRLVAKQLIKEFSADPNLAQAYKDRKVTLQTVIDYIMKKAKEVAVNNRAMVSDETVYGWAIHYVQDGDVKKQKASKLNITTISKKTEQEIAEQARKDFYEAEMKRLEEDKRKAEEKAKKEAERKAKQEAEKAERKRKKEQEREAQSNQMSLFEFFEDVEGGQA